MLTSRKVFRIFFIALIVALVIVGMKHILHLLGWEVIQQTSLHNSVISSVIFVIGFLLSATIADYKESERIPSDFSANIDDMYHDAKAIHASYPGFDLNAFREQLHTVALAFAHDVRKNTRGTRQEIRKLNTHFAAMEAANVPPNFVVKLKQQQMALLRNRYRVNYIQRIRFIPSATILARSIVAGVIVLLLLTNIDPFYAGLIITGLISFIMIYMLVLINVISTPFHAEGKTMDDVSLFLVSEVAGVLTRDKNTNTTKKSKS